MPNLLYQAPWSIRLSTQGNDAKSFEVRPQTVVYEVRQAAVYWSFTRASGRPDPPPPLRAYLGDMFWIPLHLNVRDQIGTQLVSPMAAALKAGTYTLSSPGSMQRFSILLSGWQWVYDAPPYLAGAEPIANDPAAPDPKIDIDFAQD